MSQDTATISEAWISYEAYLLEFTFARTGVFVFHFNFVLFWTFPPPCCGLHSACSAPKGGKGTFFFLLLLPRFLSAAVGRAFDSQEFPQVELRRGEKRKQNFTCGIE